MAHPLLKKETSAMFRMDTSPGFRRRMLPTASRWRVNGYEDMILLRDVNECKINSADLAIFSIFANLLIKAGPIAQLVRAPDS